MKLPLTIGQVRDALAADGLDVPLHRITYAVRKANIQPTGRAGILRLYAASTLPRIKAAVLKTQGGKSAL